MEIIPTGSTAWTMARRLASPEPPFLRCVGQREAGVDEHGLGIERQLDPACRDPGGCGAIVGLLIEADQIFGAPLEVPFPHDPELVLGRAEFRYQSEIPQVAPVK